MSAPPDVRRPLTVGEALQVAYARLELAGVPESRHEAEWLLAELLATDRGGLLVRRELALDRSSSERFEHWLCRRERREPLQRITGTQEFHGLSFSVAGPVLIPRPETEGLVDAILAMELPAGSRVADLGTGSGCIIVALGVRRRDFELYALDRSAAALEVAGRNAAAHGVAERIELQHGDLAHPPAGWSGTMDIVACNPPYVTESEWRALEPEVRDHDPKAALVAGPGGLEAFEALAPAARGLLRRGGRAVVEIGFGQSEAVRELFDGSGLATREVLPDLRGIPRILIAERVGEE